jgi:hypothetical protein
VTIPKGHSGSWFALWDGERLPCVHERCVVGSRYVDPGRNDHRCWPKFIAGIETGGKVIRTASRPSGRRASYTSVWTVKNVKDGGGMLTFDFVEQVHSFA